LKTESVALRATVQNEDRLAGAIGGWSVRTGATDSVR
jgi:hypothetical protein